MTATSSAIATSRNSPRRRPTKRAIFLIKHKDMVRKYYDAGSEVQQMFINEDIYLAHSWSGPAAKLIIDGHPIQLSVPKEGTFGFATRSTSSTTRRMPRMPTS